MQIKNSLKATDEHGMELDNPQYISESLTRQNVLIAKNQAKWLKQQAVDQNSNISAIIRQILDQTKENKN